MLTKDDKKDIREMIDGSIEKLAKDILKPAFDNMATKDDIANMAAKNDIANMATKDDIEVIKKELQTKPSTTLMNNRFDRMEERLKEEIGDTSFKRDQKLNEKTNLIVEKLCIKKVFSDKDTEDILRITPVGAV